MVKKIPLTQGQEAIVDDDDYEWLSQWKWCARSTLKTFYAVRRGNVTDGARSNKRIIMHREINRTPQNMDTDHINGNGLDNRKNNLRCATRGENNANRKTASKDYSDYKGIYFDKRVNKWRAQVQKNQKKYHIGYFSSETEAANAYKKKAEELYGEYSYQIGEDK